MVAHFKPDYAPDYLLCCNYICHLAVFQKALWDASWAASARNATAVRTTTCSCGCCRKDRRCGPCAAGALLLAGARRLHLRRRRCQALCGGSSKKALADHLARTGRTGTVEDGLFPSTYRVKWDIVGEPKVSILIPNKDHTEDLEKCLHSIWTKTSWENFEVIVIENNSTDPATFTYYKEARQRYDGLRVVTYPQKGFNFSGINNFGRQVRHRGLPAAAEQRCGGAQCRLAHRASAAVRPPRRRGHLRRRAALPGRDHAACGRCDRPWGLRGPQPQIPQGGRQRLHVPRRNGAGLFRRYRCLPAGKDQRVGRRWAVWTKPLRWPSTMWTFCLRVRDAGYRIAWTPYAQLTHYESKSRGGDEKDPVKARRFAAEQQRLYAVHGKANILHDPYYNPNLTMDREDFSESNDLRGLKEGRITVQWRDEP